VLRACPSTGSGARGPGAGRCGERLRSKKPRKANPKANKSQHWFGEKPSLVREKAKRSQGKPIEAKVFCDSWLFAPAGAPALRMSAACLRMLTDVYIAAASDDVRRHAPCAQRMTRRVELAPMLTNADGLQEFSAVDA
jgi:hypothetical protein